MLLLQAAEGAAAVPGGYGLALLQALFALAGVCALAWVTLRWAASRGLGGAASGRRIRILERAPLDARRTTWLVEVGGRVLFVGASDGGPMTVLAELSPDALTAPAPGPRFADVLRRAPVRARDAERASGEGPDVDAPSLASSRDGAAALDEEARGGD